MSPQAPGTMFSDALPHEVGYRDSLIPVTTHGKLTFGPILLGHTQMG